MVSTRRGTRPTRRLPSRQAKGYTSSEAIPSSAQPPNQRADNRRSADEAPLRSEAQPSHARKRSRHDVEDISKPAAKRSRRGATAEQEDLGPDSSAPSLDLIDRINK